MKDKLLKKLKCRTIVYSDDLGQKLKIIRRFLVIEINLVPLPGRQTSKELPFYLVYNQFPGNKNKLPLLRVIIIPIIPSPSKIFNNFMLSARNCLQIIPTLYLVVKKSATLLFIYLFNNKSQDNNQTVLYILHSSIPTACPYSFNDSSKSNNRSSNNKISVCFSCLPAGRPLAFVMKSYEQSAVCPCMGY